MDALYQARIASYQAAIDFHGAVKEYLIAKQHSDGWQEPAKQARIASQKYKAARDNLLNCLLNPSEDVEAEESEVQRMMKYFELLETMTTEILD